MKYLLISGIACLIIGAFLSFGIYLSWIDPLHNRVKWFTYVFALWNLGSGLRLISNYKKDEPEPITINGVEV